jgi:hypothetical protein
MDQRSKGGLKKPLLPTRAVDDHSINVDNGAGMSAFQVQTSQTAGVHETPLSDHDISKAAIYIMDSWTGHGTSHGVSHDDVVTVRFLHNGVWDTLYMLCIVAYMFEALLSGDTFPLAWITIAELLCFACFSYDIYEFWKVESGTSDDDGNKTHERTWPEKWTVYRAGLIAFQLLDLVIFAFSGAKTVRFSKFSRPLLLVFRVPSLRRVLVGCLVAARRIMRVLLLITCAIAFFGFVGFVLFGQLESDAKNFSSPLTGMRTMLLILTAGGTVLGFMEPLNAHSDNLASMYFILFTILVAIIFQKIVLATAYRSYKGYQKQKYFQSLSSTGRAAEAAFKIMAVDNRVSQSRWQSVFTELKGSSHPMVADTIFHTCDAEHSLVPGNGFVEIDAFKELCNMAKHAESALKDLEIHEHHELTSYESFQLKLRKKLNLTVNLCGTAVEIVHAFVDFLVLGSIAQLYYSIKYPDDPGWATVGVSILFVFTVEVVLKVAAFGWKKYISYAEHKLDFFCVASGLIFFTWNAIAGGGGANATLFSISLSIRTLRTLKFLWLSDTLTGLLYTIVKLADSLGKLLFILIIPMYMFAVIARAIFFDSVTNNPNPANPLHNPIGKTPWYPFRNELNFSTGVSSLLTMFELATLGNWNMVLSAAESLSCESQWACTAAVEIFFFGYRIIMTMIFVPILTGFLIESFVTNFDTYEKREHEKIYGKHDDHPLPHAMELRVLAAGGTAGKGKSSSSTNRHEHRKSATVYEYRDLHPKHKEVKDLLDERAAIDDVEKKIYGFEAILKEKLIKTLRQKLEDKLAEDDEKIELLEEEIARLREAVRE